MRPNMSDLDFTICCTVTFFSKKRRTPPNLNYGMYYPHIVIKGTESILASTLSMVKMSSLINQFKPMLYQYMKP